MKNISFFILIILFFAACSSKKDIIVAKVNKSKDNKVNEYLIKQKKELNELIINEDIENEFSDDANILLTFDELIYDKEKYIDVAIIYPSKIIGKYAKSGINTIVGYSFFKDMSLNLRIFDSEDESSENIEKAIFELKESGIKKVIALYTIDGLNTISNEINALDKLTIYFPLINKKDTDIQNQNFIFGAISYKEQISKLMELSNDNNYMYYQNTYIGEKLNKYYKEFIGDEVLNQLLQKKNNNYTYLLKNIDLDDKSIFLNTSIIETSIILSQFTVYEKEPFIILSTQLNYNPMLISLTQKSDRKNFFLANSIDDVDPILADIIDNLGADVIYNWVDYSVLVGINYLDDLNISNLISTKIVDNQVQYIPKIFRATDFGFLEIK